MKLVKDSKNPEMFFVEWDDGVKSENSYNLSRARDFLRRLENQTEDTI